MTNDCRGTTRCAPTEFPFEPAAVAPSLLAWYGRQGRDLPWRGTRDPYRIWLSEIMLQQTTVAAVIPYYQTFLASFPTIEKLAAAGIDEVLELWAGLGYYSRARNLHKAACQVIEVHGGKFPGSLDGLLALPGVGRSTAGAILSIAFDQPAPILDGNVRRVLVRLFAWQQDPRSREAEHRLWQWADELTSRESPHDYAQAIMDLGALVCTPRQPLCPQCPFQEICQAQQLGLVEHLPVKRRKKAVPTRHQVALLLKDGQGRLLVRQRPLSGLLGGMWEFPGVEIGGTETAEAAALRCLRELGLSAALQQMACLPQLYSHFKLELTVFYGRIAETGRVAETEAQWLDDFALGSLPLHGVQRKAYQQLSKAQPVT
ncbi:MAG: A/G-specific adenine glycosylase [Desulfuromonas sp.]|nr:MAG: A/G-specific adenine glycosylase [Desulfuromonas sp.]